MVHNKLEINLSDLHTARVRCLKCDTIVEVNTSKLGLQFTDGKCLKCGAIFYDSHENPFRCLEKAINDAAKSSKIAQISFVIDYQ